MLIAYDKKVIEAAMKVASSPTALQRDLLKFLYDEDVLCWSGPNSGPTVSYLAPETRLVLKDLIHKLPRRYKKHNKF